MYNYQSTRTLAGWLTALFVILAVLAVIGAMSSLAEAALLDRALQGYEITEDEAMANDLRQGVIAWIRVAAFLLTVVLFCVWVNRASKNAHALGAPGMRFTPGWSVGYFFIPIVNLFRPYQAIAEIYRASDPGRDPAAWQNAPAALIGIWWAVWLISNFASNIATRIMLTADTVEELHAAAIGASGTDLIEIPAAIFALVVVRSIHTRQEALAGIASAEPNASETIKTPNDEPFGF
jgi:hypothetical protein